MDGHYLNLVDCGRVTQRGHKTPSGFPMRDSGTEREKVYY